MAKPGKGSESAPPPIGGAANPWFGLYDDSLRQIAEAAAAGAVDTDLALAEIVDNAPADMRDSLVARFRSLVKEQRKTREASLPPLTPQQEQEMARMAAADRQLTIAQWLSEKTLEKIRRAFLMNPALRDQVLSIGEQLARRGLFVESGKIRADALGELRNQAAIDADKARRKDERDR